METFAKPAVSAIIEKEEHGVPYILIQYRQKADGGTTNGLIEIVGGKIREYENIFDALRREVREETGLTVTEICGESGTQSLRVGDTSVICFEPFCVTQNLSGIYSLIMQTFLCYAEGEPVRATDETEAIHWERLDDLEKLLLQHPEKFFPMDLLPLQKYIALKNLPKH